MRNFVSDQVNLGWVAVAGVVSALTVAGAAASRETAVAGRTGFSELVLQVAPDPRGTADATSRSIEVVRRRLDLFGLKDAQIIRQGPNRIAVEALGDPIPARLPGVLTRVGSLTFQLVDDGVSEADLDAGRLPAGDVLGRSADRACGFSCRFALKRKAWITGDMVAFAMQAFDQNEEPTVAFRLDQRGAALFAEATNENVGKRFAIVLDGRVIEAPTIESPIPGGQGQIMGNFTVESATDLALLLRSGALPAPISIVAERSAPPVAR